MADGQQNKPRRGDVERIVREVLRELQARRPNGARPIDAPGGNVQPSVATGELVLAARVVSMAQLENRLDGVQRVVVPRGAVFTPAARDELRKRRVAIASDARAKANPARRRVVIEVAETKYQPTALMNMLASEGIEVDRNTEQSSGSRSGLAGVIEAVERLGSAVSGGDRVGLLITGQPAAAACLANRQPGVRAAVAYNLAAVDDALTSIAANVLVVDPQAASAFEMKQMARRLAASHAACPTELAERLK